MMFAGLAGLAGLSGLAPFDALLGLFGLCGQIGSSGSSKQEVVAKGAALTGVPDDHATLAVKANTAAAIGAEAATMRPARETRSS